MDGREAGIIDLLPGAAVPGQQLLRAGAGDHREVGLEGQQRLTAAVGCGGAAGLGVEVDDAGAVGTPVSALPGQEEVVAVPGGVEADGAIGPRVGAEELRVGLPLAVGEVEVAVDAHRTLPDADGAGDIAGLGEPGAEVADRAVAGAVDRQQVDIPRAVAGDLGGVGVAGDRRGLGGHRAGDLVDRGVDIDHAAAVGGGEPVKLHRGRCVDVAALLGRGRCQADGCRSQVVDDDRGALGGDIAGAVEGADADGEAGVVVAEVRRPVEGPVAVDSDRGIGVGVTAVKTDGH